MESICTSVVVRSASSWLGLERALFEHRSYSSTKTSAQRVQSDARTSGVPMTVKSRYENQRAGEIYDGDGMQNTVETIQNRILFLLIGSDPPSPCQSSL